MAMQIEFKGVSADYRTGPVLNKRVLNKVNLAVEAGSFTAVIGHTGAGKSSLLKAMNGLLLPSEGTVKIGQDCIKPSQNRKALKKIRKRTGMVFQFPESQLFAETVEKDICFGPLNFGIPQEKAKKIAAEAVIKVGLNENVLSQSPFILSGGQKRRAAIAGVLATEPDILLLDEPSAGLDPAGKEDIMSLLRSWHDERGLTTVLVTHDMEHVACYADSVIVMDNGRIAMHASPQHVFSHPEKLKQWHLDLPEARRFQLKIELETGVKLGRVCLTTDELADALIEAGFV